MVHGTSRLARLGGALSTLGICVLAHDAPAQEPYPELTNARSQYATFNPEVMRGMAFGDNDLLYAVNAYASSVSVFDLQGVSAPASEPTSTAPILLLERWRTVHDPVAILWGGDGYVYVLGQGSHALAKHDASTGEIVDVLQLPSEPADMVLDGDGDLWVSCMGADAVVEVDLGGTSMSGQVLPLLDGVVWEHRMKRPRFLHYDAGSDRIFVAPFVSGNGTFAVGVPESSNNNSSLLETGVVLDGEALAPQGVLPDNDLFSIDPATHAVVPVVYDVATLLTGHARNPFTGDYWMLGVESLNAAHVAEPDQTGIFAVNELTVVPAAALQPNGPRTAGDVDSYVTDVDPVQGGYDPERCLSFPYALAFGQVAGTKGVTFQLAAIAGSTTPRVSLFHANGTRDPQGEMDLTGRGEVVRTLVFERDMLWMYCQQSGNLLAWGFKSASGQPHGLPAYEADLGRDPAPELVRAGRAIWYDARGSLDGRTSCNTCHPGGESDQLAWALTARNTDFKDIMVTQTLKGALDAFPFHWRGERDLIDFNPAFVGLLGHAAELETSQPGDAFTIDASEFEAFQSFVFALQPPANRWQGPERTIKSNMVPTPQITDGPSVYVGDPVEGMHIFLNDVPDPFVPQNCSNCHALPTGSLGIMAGDNNTHADGDWRFQTLLAKNVETAQLHNISALKHQGLGEDYLYDDGVDGHTPTSYSLPFLGFGHFNTGIDASAASFLERQFFRHPTFTGAYKFQAIADTAAFVQAFDTGTASGVHLAYHMNAQNHVAIAPAVGALLGQVVVAAGPHAGQRWLDVVALRYVSGAHVSYLYDPTLAAFTPDDGSAVLTLQDLEAAAQGTGVPVPVPVTFLGCLPGQGRRLGLDFDDDGLDNVGEPGGDERWNPDRDHDHYPDGYEVAHSGQGGDPDDPSTHPKEGIRPLLLGPNGPISAAVQGAIAPETVTGRIAKFHFEATEPVRWKLAAIGPNGQSFTSSSTVFATRHTAVLRGLRPSGPSTGTGTGNFLADYDITLTLTDLSNNSSTYTGIDAETKTFPQHLNDPQRLVVLADSFDLAPVPAQANTFDATISVTVGDFSTEDLGVRTTQQVQPGVDDKWVVVANLLKRLGPDDPWLPVPVASVVCPNGTSCVASLTLSNGTTYAPAPNAPLDVDFLLLPAVAPTAGSLVALTLVRIKGDSSSESDYALSIFGVFREAAAGSHVLQAGSDSYQMPLTATEHRLLEGQ